jgi:sporulation protein YlmC with PRC-barrel domain
VRAAIAPADSLEGGRIVDAAGADVGVIEDLMIDAGGGRVAYIVMSLAAPREGQVVAVPWAALTHDGERRCFVIDEAFRYR